MALWGGRFREGADPLFRAFNDSLPVDRRLVEHDIAGSIAWAHAIERAGVLTAREGSDLRAALARLLEDVRAEPAMIESAADEDVHSWVEARLTERTGDLARKLHTGRSRNDQVATDLRLYARRAALDRREELRGLRSALIELGLRHAEAPAPGYTHLQLAQPIVFGHWCHAYERMLARDEARFRDAQRRADRCPLGAGALAGTPYLVDREAIARDLGFAAPTENSLDAVSDRDFLFDLLSAAALCAAHLSRLAEDCIVYASAEFGLIELPDEFTSGSSLMPQKKNPDALELIRGKCAGLITAPATLLILLKGLPLAYNKDLQEDKAPVFRAMDDLSACLRILARLVPRIRLDGRRAREAAMRGHSNATELADFLVGRGVPFREAHEVAGRAVLAAIDRGVTLESMPIAELRAIDARFSEAVFATLTPESALARRDVFGGTAPRRVREALESARAELEGDASC